MKKIKRRSKMMAIKPLVSYKTIEEKRLIAEGKDPKVERMLNDMEVDRFKRGYYK